MINDFVNDIPPAGRPADFFVLCLPFFFLSSIFFCSSVLFLPIFFSKLRFFCYFSPSSPHFSFPPPPLP